MTIAMDQIARRDGEPADLHGSAVFGNVCVHMSDCHATGKHGKTEIVDAGKVAHRTVCDIASAMQGRTNGGVQLADQRAYSGRILGVFDHHDARLRDGGDIPPPMYIFVIRAPLGRLGGRSHAPGRGVPEHRRKVGKDTVQRATENRTFVAQSHVEPLDGVRDDAGIKFPDLFEGSFG